MEAGNVINHVSLVAYGPLDLLVFQSLIKAMQLKILRDFDAIYRIDAYVHAPYSIYLRRPSYLFLLD